jgi:pyruvate dehydrogenase E2 component (dihydrolipoamide acetyltransferase)
VKQTLIMPNLGAAAGEATLVAWLVRVGDRVSVGQEMFEVETDKATVPVEATEPAVVVEILVEKGSTVTIGTPIAVLEVEGSNATAPDEPATSGSNEAPAAATTPVAGARDEPAVSGERGLSPRARRLAGQLGVDPTGLIGTGPDGRIVEADVQAAYEARQPAVRPTDAAEKTDPLAGLSGHRAVVARAMATSHHDTAAVTLTFEAPATGLLKALGKLRQTYPATAAAITVDLVIAVAVARALRNHPQLNASLGSTGIIVNQAVNVGIAIDSPRGLIVPVLRAAATSPLDVLAREWGQLRERALAGTATPQDLADGTFTITNLGPLGIDAFTPIINRAECAILGIGRIAPRAVVVDGMVTAMPVVVLSLTFDHRIVDGAAAARFLGEVAATLGQDETITAENA